MQKNTVFSLFRKRENTSLLLWPIHLTLVLLKNFNISYSEKSKLSILQKKQS